MKILSNLRLAQFSRSVLVKSAVYTNVDANLTFQVNPSKNRLGEYYFKIYNHFSANSATKVARISFFEPRYIFHTRSAWNPWTFDSSTKKIVVDLLSKNSYSVWKKLIANFNNALTGIYCRKWSFFTSNVKEILLKCDNKQDTLSLRDTSNKDSIKAYKFMMSALQKTNDKQMNDVSEEAVNKILSNIEYCMPINLKMPDYKNL